MCLPTHSRKHDFRLVSLNLPAGRVFLFELKKSGTDPAMGYSMLQQSQLLHNEQPPKASAV